jgi:hypothetical protein
MEDLLTAPSAPNDLLARLTGMPAFLASAVERVGPRFRDRPAAGGFSLLEQVCRSNVARQPATLVDRLPGASYESVGRTFESCRAHHPANDLE